MVKAWSQARINRLLASAHPADGAPPLETPVCVVERAGGANGRELRTTLARLPEAIRAASVSNPAIILIHPPRAMARAQSALAMALAG